jgi:hypothetical protein
MAGTQVTRVRAEKLTDKLNRKLATSTYPEPCAISYDANYNAFITVTLSASIDAIIELSAASGGANEALNAIGGTQSIYTPILINVLTDTSSSTGTTETVKFALFCELANAGSKLSLYQIDASGKGGNKYLETTDIVVGNFVTSYVFNPEWGISATV